jgi:hypothetical protein
MYSTLLLSTGYFTIKDTMRTYGVMERIRKGKPLGEPGGFLVL